MNKTMRLVSRQVCYPVVLMSFFLATVGVRAQTPLGTAFTYQGQLQNNAVPENGSCDLQFKLFDAATGGSQIGSTITDTAVTITNGLFTVTLDFGSGAFAGSARWLEIAVACPSGSGFTTLAPRQELTPSPNALFASGAPPVGSAGGSLSGTYPNPAIANNAVNTVQIANNAVTAPKIASGQVVKNLNGLFDGVTLSPGSGISITPSGQTLTFAATGAAGWGVTGNSGLGCGTSPCSSFLGTTDANDALELRVANNRVIRIEPATDGANGFAPNIIGGNAANSASGAGVAGATIAGGGYAAGANTVTHSFGTVGGGAVNSASGGYATVGGGSSNSASNFASTAAGGSGNMASGRFSAVAGGTTNSASEDYSAVGGGSTNVASGTGSTVAGGTGNNASSDFSTVGGGNANTASGLSFSTVSGGDVNSASGDYSAVGGGNSNTASGEWSTVAGGNQNTASGAGSFAAGQMALANADGCFVWSDGTNPAGCGGPSFPNRFVVLASGGTFFYSNSSGTTGVILQPGSGSWSSVSDRNVKENFEAVDDRRILERVAALPISTWNYKGADAPYRHLGPMAQDFFAAFRLGEDDRHITEIDEAGVAFAAIQGLNEKLEAEIEKKDAEIAGLKTRLETLETALIGGRSK